MPNLWFFTHAGLTCGPVPADHLDQMIASGVLGEQEFVWLDDVDVQITVDCYRQIHRGGSLPKLVGALRQSGAPRPKVTKTPDWLADVRAYERRAEAFRPVPLQAPGLPRVPPEWLNDIRQIEDSRRRRQAPPKQRPTGFDPDTGLILDAIAFVKWSREEQTRRREELARQPAVAVGEAFLAARKVLQDWIDSEANKPLVISGNQEAIRRAVAMQGVLNAYLGYGPVMQEKLMKHLDFLAENRRKFYRDFDASKKAT